MDEEKKLSDMMVKVSMLVEKQEMYRRAIETGVNMSAALLKMGETPNPSLKDLVDLATKKLLESIETVENTTNPS